MAAEELAKLSQKELVMLMSSLSGILSTICKKLMGPEMWQCQMVALYGLPGYSGQHSN